MAEERFEVQAAIPERYHVRIYHDFLRTKNLTTEEKMVYIALKSFLDFKRDEGQVFPSMETLCQLTSMSRPRATRAITSLTRKGVLKKTRRGLTKPNLYTLYDNPAMWSAGTVNEMTELAESNIPYTTQELIDELKRRGVCGILKEKEPSVVGATEGSINELYSIPTTNDNLSHEKLQEEKKRYSLAEIREMMNYDLMIAEDPHRKNLIDEVIEVIRDTLNTTKKTLKVGQEDTPSSEIKERFRNLNHIMIMQCIDSVIEQSEMGEPPKNVQSYLRTTLYRAKSTDAKIELQARHDMLRWNSSKKNKSRKPEDDWYDNY